MEKDRLFGEFPPVTTEQWEEAINLDLKGADYEKKLVWNTGEGFKLKPYYRAEDLKQINNLQQAPGQFPFVRGNKTENNNWDIRQDVAVTTVAEANASALEALERGATAIGFVTADKVKTADDLAKLLKDIHFECINFNLVSGSRGPDLFSAVIDEARKRGADLDAMSGSVDFDPLTILTTSGNFAQNETADFVIAKSLIEKASVLPGYRVLAANAYLLREAGAGIVQEVAFSLAIANEYLNRLTDQGLSVDAIAPRIQFNTAIGGNYFLELAKIRAMRVLWAKVVNEYKPAKAESAKTFIHSVTTEWNKTAFDPNANMLRTTTEAMSAVLGGTDSLTVLPFDSIFKKSSSFSNRIARNTQIILKEESYMDRIVDPAAGSYYIETLTSSIVAEAWKLFLKVDEKGGYLAALKEGFIQNEVETMANGKFANVSSRRDTVLGTNQYPNFKEQILPNIEADVYSNAWNVAANQVVKPLKKQRMAQFIEELRLRTEKSGKRPVVFMLTIGSLAMRLARSQFSCNFFGIAGFETIDNNGFKTSEEGVKAALDAKADIVVICSSDEEYPALAPEVFEKLAGKAIFVVAGAPACTDELKAKGIQNFINVKSNVLETLSVYQKSLGI